MIRQQSRPPRRPSPMAVKVTPSSAPAGRPIVRLRWSWLALALAVATLVGLALVVAVIR